ncbi:PaaI family thioesterase [Ottowia thiooxydans]|uniref:PaaI family thioesterase n=1 Tax=Ottowia thiooxydans TaxID=219182 RepID=UPI0004248409|nr:PaaI family thioesterase [Ottowia thiooxydans]
MDLDNFAGSSHAAPEGFVDYIPSSEFMRMIGPVYARLEADKTTTVALFVRAEHLNSHAVAHGGMLATVIDSALGFNASRIAGASTVTANLSITYLGEVKEGDWLQVGVRVDRLGKRLVFLSCRGQVGEKTVVKADGVFAVKNRVGVT